MRQIKDHLRLRHDAGISLREIGRSLNLSVGVVSKYLQLAAAAGIGWPPPAEIDEGALARKIQPPAAADLFTAPLPNFAELHQELRRKGVTLQLLCDECHRAHDLATQGGLRSQENLCPELSRDRAGKDLCLAACTSCDANAGELSASRVAEESQEKRSAIRPQVSR